MEVEADDISARELSDSQVSPRDGAVSPSTISTASSAAPLVRNGSNSSRSQRFMARPKVAASAASIAAAQLQCQQEQKKKLEFSNKLSSKQVNGFNWLTKGAEWGNQSHLNEKVTRDKGEEANGPNGNGFTYSVSESLRIRANR